MKSKMVILVALSVLSSGSAFASTMACKSSNTCNQLKEAISQVKTQKGKRHKDVVEFGRESAQVKSDDRALMLAVQNDREIRAERKIEKPKNPTPGKRRVGFKGRRRQPPKTPKPA